MKQVKSKSRAMMLAETRAALITAGRRAFAEKGFAAASMDDLTADVGLTRGALYHHFGDKKGLLAAVVAQVDSEMAARALLAGQSLGNGWDALLAQGIAYIEAAMDPEVQRIVLLDGPAFLGDPSQWPSQNSCLKETREALIKLSENGILKPVNIEAASRLLNGAALNAALWVAASDNPSETLPKALEAFRLLASGFLAK